LPKNFGDIGKFGDIGTFSDMGTKIDVYVEQFLNFIGIFSIDSYKVNYKKTY
jgi:hypothetical protein